MCSRTAEAFEHFPPSSRLAVVPVLDLDPSGRSVRDVSAVLPFCDDSLQVRLTHEAEKLCAATLEVVDVDDVSRLWRNYAPQDPLPLNERQVSEILAVEFQEVECIEMRWASAAHQRQEISAAVL